MVSRKAYTQGPGPDASTTAAGSPSLTTTSTASTATATRNVVAASSLPTQDVWLDYTCSKANDGKNITVTAREGGVDKPWTFQLYCGASFDGSNIVAQTTYRLEDCLRSCAAYNRYIKDVQETKMPECAAVEFDANMSWDIVNLNGNCHLKYKTDTRKDSTSTQNVAAYLVGRPA
ncbi:hypothetical protein PGQ11_012693 [Apiospora arundinis]|uniref:Apple domain-containing protein n=1 Tax=Apiospora arundinis TaxID=335852 RepID=A0ABR2I358_9PEZI